MNSLIVEDFSDKDLIVLWHMNNIEHMEFMEVYSDVYGYNYDKPEWFNETQHEIWTTVNTELKLRGINPWKAQRTVRI